MRSKNWIFIDAQEWVYKKRKIRASTKLGLGTKFHDSS